MLQQNTFFEGHRGGVLSLAGDSMDNYFFSSGSEGLIVRWQLDSPNEGQVLTKLSGYVSALTYDKKAGLIYAAVNHKGIYVINATSGRVIRIIDLPGTSFGKVYLEQEMVIITTKLGEIILYSIRTDKIAERIETGLDGFSQLVIDSGLLWYISSIGIRNLNLKTLEEKGIDIEIAEKVKSIGLSKERLVILTKNSISIYKAKKERLRYELSPEKGYNFCLLSSVPKNSKLHVLTSQNEFLEYNIQKKEIQLVEKHQFGHKEQINDLLWIENYKFVISASSDKKIGVWQIN